MNPETRVNNAINECVIVAREPDCVEDVDRLHELIVESTDGKTNTTRESLREEFLGLDYSKLTSVKPKDLDIDFNIKAFQPNRPIARAILAELPDTHEIVGYLIFHYYFTPWIGHSACVDYVYVVPSYRKQGECIIHVSTIDICWYKSRCANRNDRVPFRSHRS